MVEITVQSGDADIIACIGGDTAQQGSFRELVADRVDKGFSAVQFVAGLSAAQEQGDVELTLAHWKKAWDLNIHYQRRIIDILVAQQVSPAYFVDQFNPEWQELNRIRQGYRDAGLNEQLVTISQLLAEKSIERAEQATGSEAAEAWLSAHESFAVLNNLDRANTCLQKALEADSTSFDVRYAVGLWLYRQCDFKSASDHLTWCSRRKPRDEKLQKLTSIAKKNSLNAIPNTAEIPGGNSTF